MEEGEHLTGNSVVALNSIIEVKPLPKGSSAQKTELIVLTQALHSMGSRIQVNIYTDSKYTFATLNVHGALFKEKGLIKSGGKDTKYGK